MRLEALDHAWNTELQRFSFLRLFVCGSAASWMISDLIQDKGGDKLIEYLATTKGGRNMGTMMTAVPGGTDLNKATNRIYTLAEFETALAEALGKTSP